MELACEPSKKQWKVLQKAARLQWQTKLDDAEELVKDTVTSNIWIAAAFTEIALWRWNYTQKEEYEKELLVRMESFSKYSQDIYDRNNPKGSWFGKTLRDDITEEEQYRRFLIGIIVLAYSELCYTLYHFRKRNLVKGAYHVRKSWLYFREARDCVDKQHSLGHKQNDDRITGLVNFGVGIFHFGASLVPPSYVWVTKALGFEADRDNSLVTLKQSLESKGPKSVEAAIILVLMYQFFIDKEAEALELVQALEADYPGSPVLAYMFAFVKRINGQIDDAIAGFETAIKGIEIEQLNITMHYHLSVTYFLAGDYKRALPLLELFLEKSTVDQFRPYACYLLGLCYWMTDTKRDAIVPLYQKIKGWVKTDQAFDLHAERKAKEFFDQGNRWTAFDIAWLQAIQMHEARKYKECLVKVKDVKRTAMQDPDVKTMNPERQCRLLFIRGSCYRGLHKYEKARGYLERCLELDDHVKAEKWTMAYSHVDLAEIFLEEGHFDEALKHLKKAKSYKDFDWANIINLRITSAEQRTSLRRKAAQSAASTSSTSS